MCKHQIGYGRLEEDEDMIIGTKEGLKYLIDLCTEAINKGQSKTHSECEIFAIKKVESDYFIDNEVKESFLFKVLGLASLGLALASLIVGFGTIVSWMFK